MKKRYYIGITHGEYTLFTSECEPSQGTFGDSYVAVVGAFRTKRGAEYALREWSSGNLGHYNQTVNQCERIAKQQYELKQLAQAGRDK